MRSVITLQVNPLFGTIYNSIYLLAKSIHNTRKGGLQVTGSNLAYFVKNTTFSGFNQKVKLDNHGEVRTSYVILDSDNTGSQLYQTYMVDLVSGHLYFAGRSINFPGGSPPSSDSNCWFYKNGICTGGKRIHFVCPNIGFVYSGFHTFMIHTLYVCHLLISPHFNIIKSLVLILRCGDHLHHSGACCHRQSCCRRACYKSLYQVHPGI